MNRSVMQLLNHRRYITLLLLLAATSILPADNGTGKMQLLRIKNVMKGGDYVGALRSLRSLEKTDTSTAELYYLSGSCNFHLKNYPDAIERFERSIRLDPENDLKKYYFLGRSYQAEGQLEAAITSYQQFLDREKRSKDEREEASQYLDQSRRAMEMMKKPVNVKIRNLGDAINSDFPEYNPSVSADGNTLIFTSRRPGSTGGQLDPDDGKFYEDIYVAVRDSVTGAWKEAEQVAGQLNTDGHDANMSLSPDGSQIFVYRNMGYRGSGQIYVSKKSNTGKWGAAKPVEGDINTSYFESSACISPDGKTLYFVSERPKGGFGMGDIYKARRVNKTQWGTAENLGPVINDEYDQIGVFVHPDGKTLYFASDSPKGIGGYDIYKSTFENGKWSEPENLGYPINTPGDERFFVLSTDNRTAWFSSNRNGTNGDLDIWEVDMTGLFSTKEMLSREPGLSIFSGQVLDADAAQIVEAELMITDTQNNKKVSVSTDENGNYFITLDGNRNYTVTINHKGYQPYTYELFLPAKEEGTFTQEKTIVLERIQ